jgi:hypothetical protein
MRKGSCQRANPAAGFVDLRILAPVVVAWNDVDSVDAVRVEEDFTESGAIKRVVVGIGLESHDGAGAGVPAQVFAGSSGLLKFSLEAGEGRTGRATTQRSMDVGSMTQIATAMHALTVAETGRGAKRLCRNAVRIDSRLDAIEELASQGWMMRRRI